MSETDAERVARAMSSSLAMPWTWEEINPDNRDHWMRLAHVALAEARRGVTHAAGAGDEVLRIADELPLNEVDVSRALDLWYPDEDWRAILHENLAKVRAEMHAVLKDFATTRVEALAALSARVRDDGLGMMRAARVLATEEKYLKDLVRSEHEGPEGDGPGIMPGDVEGSFHRIREALRTAAPEQGADDGWRPRRWTNAAINKWIVDTFGHTSSNISVVGRANEEMAELLQALAVRDDDPKAAEETADIVIILLRLAARMGFDLDAEIDKKMDINVKRTWQVANGHGYHVKPFPFPPTPVSK